MSTKLTRRDFIKLSLLSLTGLAFHPKTQRNYPTGFQPDFPRRPDQPLGRLARVASRQVDVRSRPDDQAPIVGNRFRDQLIHIYADVRPPDAPRFYNTLWYRVWGGYIHSAHLQLVDLRFNSVERRVAKAGQLTEVTVPYTTAYQLSRSNEWAPWRGSRLYYSFHTLDHRDPNWSGWGTVVSGHQRDQRFGNLPCAGAPSAGDPNR